MPRKHYAYVVAEAKLLSHVPEKAFSWRPNGHAAKIAPIVELSRIVIPVFYNGYPFDIVRVERTMDSMLYKNPAKWNLALHLVSWGLQNMMETFPDELMIIGDVVYPSCGDDDGSKDLKRATRQMIEFTRLLIDSPKLQASVVVMVYDIMRRLLRLDNNERLGSHDLDSIKGTLEMFSEPLQEGLKDREAAQLLFSGIKDNDHKENGHMEEEDDHMEEDESMDFQKFPATYNSLQAIKEDEAVIEFPVARLDQFERPPRLVRGVQKVKERLLPPPPVKDKKKKKGRKLVNELSVVYRPC
ncbi:hypothetical protein GNI_174000 [Gregarina niphandrodes]|uniref:Uncharacterized protein n=1 Tax=Gregarina niphandrodes TaxID=110365 RepID=A0A023AXP2_GRENI|nr:hypothetical protein GNI_174000 [Gregarina niphandrodes]EZG43394.1 hypothetical protein GNI_174000 [Gregarina niphandrodes]|eukprot:XP_011133375.1 hypothetical protein GNI_174000 [Gregarina niphandrodes]